MNEIPFLNFQRIVLLLSFVTFVVQKAIKPLQSFKL